MLVTSGYLPAVISLVLPGSQQQELLLLRIDRSAAIIACGSLVSRVIDHVDLNKEECGLRAEATTTPLMKARAFLAGRPD
jgi:hypothetical protein